MNTYLYIEGVQEILTKHIIFWASMSKTIIYPTLFLMGIGATIIFFQVYYACQLSCNHEVLQGCNLCTKFGQSWPLISSFIIDYISS